MNRPAVTVLPQLLGLHAAGGTGFAGLAAALNARGLATARGWRWHVSTMRNVLRRGG